MHTCALTQLCYKITCTQGMRDLFFGKGGHQLCVRTHTYTYIRIYKQYTDTRTHACTYKYMHAYRMSIMFMGSDLYMCKMFCTSVHTYTYTHMHALCSYTNQHMYTCTTLQARLLHLYRERKRPIKTGVQCNEHLYREREREREKDP